ncbi:DNA internalization-related competence protein ComEC/Rec2 [Aquibacillus sediminis]|uniref:DNA internalization-related competence protein ComEC/Rec2 n=1 Tax=Aquibacillus sediminis TaxID=2574734 RepID=UPI0011082ED3|nr:DNA internalization-related competence protein ComEC/Rec2 [Aquibacillus sediminis]
MVKGYWHIVSLSVVVAYLTISFNTLIILIIFCVWLYWMFQQKRLKILPVILSVLMLPLSMLNFHQATASINTNQEPSQVEQFNGNIISPITETDQKVEFVLKDTQQRKLLLTFFKNSYDESTPLSTAKHGAECSVKGKRSEAPSSRNPSQFDYRNYLKNQAIAYQVLLKDPNDISCDGASLLSNIYQLRSRLIAYVSDSYSTFTASWIQALLLGDDSNLDEQMVEIFRHWNLSHLLAISGLHVGLIVGIVYFMLVKFGLVTKEKVEWAMLLMLPLYAILAGGAPSVWRSSLMTVFGLLLLKWKGKQNATDILSIVFLLLLLFNPLMINHLGFQFSFLVTFAILLSKEWLQSNTSKMFLLLKISLLSQMVLLPLQVFYFYFINPTAIFINLLLVPYFTVIIIPFVLVLLIVSIVIPVIVPVVDKIFLYIHQTVLGGLEIVDQLLFYPWVLGQFPTYIMPFYIITFVLFMGGLIKQQYRRAFQYGTALIFTLIIISFQPYVVGKGNVTMLDVGQGDCFIIELPYRKGVIVIDAAGALSSDFVTPSDKTYTQIIKPYLYSKGITKIDALILSHQDNDHVGSVPYLLNDFQINQLVISDYASIPKETMTLMRKQPIQVKTVQSNNIINVGEQNFYVLHPDHDYQDTNNNSVVVFTEIGGLRWLFTGDISKQMEANIVAAYPKLDIDVLKVPHHGSNTSSSELLLEHTTPSVAWISVGMDNRYGHPDNAVIDRFRQQGVLIMRTDLRGAVQYKFSQDKGTFFQYLP